MPRSVLALVTDLAAAVAERSPAASTHGASCRRLSAGAWHGACVGVRSRATRFRLKYRLSYGKRKQTASQRPEMGRFALKRFTLFYPGTRKTAPPHESRECKDLSPTPDRDR